MSSLVRTHKNAVNLGKVCQSFCYECNRNTNWEYGKLTEWLKLKSLKVLPFKKEYFIFCESCGDDFELPKQDFREVEFLNRQLSSIDHSNVKNKLFEKIHQTQLTSKNQKLVDDF